MTGNPRRRQALSGRTQAALALAGMAATIAVGVGAVLVIPKPRPPGALELARPAPIARAELPAWLAPAVAPPAPVPAALPAPEPDRSSARAAARPVKPPPLRTRRLELAQVGRPHAVRPRILVVLPPPPPLPPARPRACWDPETAADRLVCSRPRLAREEKALLRAYNRALAAGADRLAVDRAQAKWRNRRDRATSADELARLYAGRISELDDTARQLTGRRRTYG